MDQVGPIAARASWAVGGEGGRARRHGGAACPSRHGGRATGPRPASLARDALRGLGTEAAGSGGARRAGAGRLGRGLPLLCKPRLRPPAPGSFFLAFGLLWCVRNRPVTVQRPGACSVCD